MISFLRKKTRAKDITNIVEEEKELLPQSYIIEMLIKTCNYSSYLELGVGYGVTFLHNYKLLDKAICVDVETKDFIPEECFRQMTTSEFFTQNTDTLDLIFIDACHQFSFVKEDFENALKVLNPQGLIMLHDTNPKSSDLISEENKWCGNAYLMNKYLEEKHPELLFVTLPVANEGISIVHRKLDLRFINYN